jgi:flagellar motor protein MotB
LNNTKKQWAKIQKNLNHSVYCSSNELKISQYFKINTVMIEGHTDQNNNKIADEAELSAKRATNTFKQIRDKQLLISGLTNVNGDPIFGYAGYGRSRPLIKNAKSIIQKANNRRLEFRFLFDSPKKNILTKILEDL